MPTVFGPPLSTPPSSSAGFLLSDARDWIRQWARNAQSSAQYSESDIDRALYAVGSRFCRKTRSITTTLFANTEFGVNGGGFTINISGAVLMPEQLLTVQVGGTNNGNKLQIIHNDDLLAMVDANTDGDGNTTTGQPVYGAIANSLDSVGAGAAMAINIYPYADVEYQMICKVWVNFTRWTMGTASPELVALCIPEPTLVQILSTGAVSFLQFNQPEMRYASESWAKYLEIERSHQGAGILGLRVLDRVRRP